MHFEQTPIQTELRDLARKFAQKELLPLIEDDEKTELFRPEMIKRLGELGLTPAVTTGILHRSAGTGQVGAGVAEAPLACFAAALADLDRRLSAAAP